jgi:DNA-binding response OmpR family regulator
MGKGPAAVTASIISAGSVTLDLETRRIIDGRGVALRLKRTNSVLSRILACLMQKHGKVVRMTELLSAAYPDDDGGRLSANTCVRNLIRNFRERMVDSGIDCSIELVPNTGYRFHDYKEPEMISVPVAQWAALRAWAVSVGRGDLVG